MKVKKNKKLKPEVVKIYSSKKNFNIPIYKRS
jgi:hypothetical protein